jgi:hypothetical protein
LGKIKPLKKAMGVYQNGLRDGGSVIGNIFALRIMNKKIWEYNQSVQYLFIDFQKAYDSIHRDAMWKCMEGFKIPTKLINMCKTRVQMARSAVRIEGTLSYFFENSRKTGLKQGDTLSPILFNLALRKVVRRIKMLPSAMKIGKEQFNISVYADDIALIGKNEIEIRKFFCRNGKLCQKICTTDKPRKDKIYDSGKEKKKKEK